MKLRAFCWKKNKYFFFSSYFASPPFRHLKRRHIMPINGSLLIGKKYFVSFMPRGGWYKRWFNITFRKNRCRPAAGGARLLNSRNISRNIITRWNAFNREHHRISIYNNNRKTRYKYFYRYDEQRDICLSTVENQSTYM